MMDNNDIFRLSDSKLKVDSLQQRVYDRIKKMILTNKLQPGQNISIDQLASDLGVSHTPVREALAMLKLDGLVSTGYHKTPKVTDIDDLDVKEIYDVRKMLEGYAIRKAAENLTAEDLSILRKTIADYESKVDSEGLQEFLAISDINFHGLIVSKVENNIYFRLYRLIEDMSLRIRTLVIVHSAEKIDVISAEHYAIFDALEKRDTEKAYKAMINHLTNACKRTLDAVAQLETSSS